MKNLKMLAIAAITCFALVACNTTKSTEDLVKEYEAAAAAGNTEQLTAIAEELDGREDITDEQAMRLFIAAMSTLSDEDLNFLDDEEVEDFDMEDFLEEE